MDFQLKLNSETVEHAHPAAPSCMDIASSIRQVFEFLKEQRTGGVMICEDGVLAGIFTERDALKLMASGANLDRPVREVMVRAPVTVTMLDSLGSAIAEMSEGGYRRLPIIDGAGRPVGMLKVSSILRYLVEHFPNVVYNLPPDPHHSAQQREGA